jgi:transposase-like protein
MKKPIGRPPKHPTEFRTAVARRVADGQLSYREAGRLYGVSHGTLSSWMKKYGSGTLHQMQEPKSQPLG